MEWMEIIKLAILCISILSSIVITTVNSIKGRSKVKGAEAKEMLISEIIPAAVIKAEKIGVNGEVKKTIAISNIMMECAANNIEFSQHMQLIEEEIEKLIDVSKSVNAKTKNY